MALPSKTTSINTAPDNRTASNEPSSHDYPSYHRRAVPRRDVMRVGVRGGRSRGEADSHPRPTVRDMISCKTSDRPSSTSRAFRELATCSPSVGAEVAAAEVSSLLGEASCGQRQSDDHDHHELFHMRLLPH
jgi:hypothetical protein